MICEYRIGDLPQPLREEIAVLHTSVFGDSRAWICDFLSAAKDERYLAFTAEGAFCGGMFLLSAFLCGEGKRLFGDYLFALAVKPAYRGRGIAAALLEFAKAGAKDFLLLVPADGRLAAFYKARGFTLRLPGITAVDGKGAAPDLPVDTACGEADALRAAEICGLRLSAPLFAFALAERGLATVKSEGGVYAVRENQVFAAFGASKAHIHCVEDKALAYAKAGKLPRVYCDLLFEG